jgi:hypothetical protein
MLEIKYFRASNLSLEKQITLSTIIKRFYDK